MSVWCRCVVDLSTSWCCSTLRLTGTNGTRAVAFTVKTISLLLQCCWSPALRKGLSPDLSLFFSCRPESLQLCDELPVEVASKALVPCLPVSSLQCRCSKWGWSDNWGEPGRAQILCCHMLNSYKVCTFPLYHRWPPLGRKVPQSLSLVTTTTMRLAVLLFLHLQCENKNPSFKTFRGLDREMVLSMCKTTFLS